MRLAPLLFLPCLLWATPSIARGQCTRDVDCKADRICEAGRCVDPPTAAPIPVRLAPAPRTGPRCSPGPQGATYQPLRPVGDRPPPLEQANRSTMTALRYRLEVVDAREGPCTLFGRADRGPDLHTREDLPGYVARHLAAALGQYGLQLVASGEDVVLRVALARALVEEGNLYQGEVRVQVDARRAAQPRPFWSGAVTGTSNRWGRTGKLELYQDTLGHAVLDAARALMNDDALRVAISLAMAPAPPAAK